MRTRIDKAGRIVLPKRLRDALGLAPGTALEVQGVDDRLDIDVTRSRATLVDGPDGRPLIDSPGAGRLTTDDIRAWRLRLQDPGDRGDDR